MDHPDDQQRRAELALLFFKTPVAAHRANSSDVKREP
jgi:hypothetical protein